MRRAAVFGALAASYTLLIGFFVVLAVALTSAIADGWALRQAALRHEDGSPRFSPDGSRIAWIRRDDNGPQLWVMLADGSEQQPLGTATRFRWTRGGTALLFSRGGARVFVVDPESAVPAPAGRARLAAGKPRDVHGRRQVFVRGDRLYLRLPNGTEQALT